MTADDASPLFEYPPKAAFGKPLPKNKIYAHGKPTRRLRQRFTDEIAQIVWKHKLAPETIGLPARDGIEEIQIFSVTLKASAKDEITEDVLRCIDRAIGSQIVFEIIAGERLRVVAAYKRSSEADTAKWVVGDYFMSAWFPVDVPRAPLPVALDLAALYTQMLRRLMPHPPREGESLKDHAERIAEVHAVERERGKLEAKIAREPQFNRQVELNAQMRALAQQFEQLIQTQQAQDR